MSAVVSLVVALITSLLAPTVKYGFDKRLERRKLELAYRAEQSKALRDRIGLHKGTILASAEELTARIRHYHDTPKATKWLEGPARRGYYRSTFVYRVLACWYALESFAEGAIYIDAEVATKGDWVFAKAIKLNLDVWSDVRLFHGLDYDPGSATDHFFRNQITRLVAAFRSPEEDRALTWTEFEHALKVRKSDFEDVFSYLTFADLRQELRYQRLMAAFLVLVATINAFGYDYQRVSDVQTREIAATCSKELKHNLLEMMRRLRLQRERGFQELVKILDEG